MYESSPNRPDKAPPAHSMNEDSFSWPEDADECAALARSMFISESVSNVRYWLDWGSDFLTHPQPATPHVRGWSDVAKLVRPQARLACSWPRFTAFRRGIY